MKKVLFLLIAASTLTTSFAQTTQKKHKKHKTATTKTISTKTTEVSTASVATPTPEEMEAKKAAAVSVASAATNAPVEFMETKHSFGKIKQGVPATYIFTFRNASGGPVIIENATAQCGCTKPEFPQGPIQKGSKGEIKVTYNAVAIGNFTKQVTVNVAKYSQPITLTIDGEVLAPATPAEEKKEPQK